jgi:pimeloyl-ACP methyl ester carboxylesterase
MVETVTRHFVTLGRRQVHYRRAGHGVPVLLLHPSPESSAEFLPLITRLSRGFTVIAPDTPGNGLSDPLDETWPEMSAFADALVAVMDALDLKQAALYGYHTGGLCALEMARRHPQRVSLCVVNGYLQMPQAIQRDIVENYFVQLAPVDWSGSHLTWLWSRMREQWNFFPWYKKTLAFRTAFDPPDAAALQVSVMHMLAAGDGYRGAYRAAFAFDAPNAVAEIQAPTLITCARDDILFPSLQAMPRPADCVIVEAADTLAECEDLLERALTAAPSQSVAPPAPMTLPVDGDIWSDMIQVAGLSLHARRSASGSGPAILFIPDIDGSSRVWERTMRPFLGRRPVIAIDPPGRGESDPWPQGAAPTVVAQAEIISYALRKLGYADIDLIADKNGAALAVALADMPGTAIRHILLLEPPLQGGLPDRPPLSLTPDDHGCHLLKAWHTVRDRELYYPWYDRRLEASITWREPDLDPAETHQRTLALLACIDALPAFQAAADAYPVRDRLIALDIPTLIGCPDSPLAPGFAAPHIRIALVPHLEPERFVRDALAFFDNESAIQA